jgi:hypothetical protein
MSAVFVITQILAVGMPPVMGDGGEKGEASSVSTMERTENLLPVLVKGNTKRG